MASLKDQAFRNERKRHMCETWLRLGLVQIHFDATREDVAIPEWAKIDPDYWIAIVEAMFYTSHIEGTCEPKNRKCFQFSIPWDAVHSMYSQALHERHTWVEDVSRATKRQEVRRWAKTGKPIPS